MPVCQINGVCEREDCMLASGFCCVETKSQTYLPPSLKTWALHVSRHAVSALILAKPFPAAALSSELLHNPD